MHRKYDPHRGEERPARAMNEGWLLRRHEYGPQRDVFHRLKKMSYNNISLSMLFRKLVPWWFYLDHEVWQFLECDYK